MRLIIKTDNPENEWSRRKHNNRILNVVSLATVIAVIVLYAVQHGGAQ